MSIRSSTDVVGHRYTYLASAASTGSWAASPDDLPSTACTRRSSPMASVQLIFNLLSVVTSRWETKARPNAIRFISHLPQKRRDQKHHSEERKPGCCVGMQQIMSSTKHKLRTAATHQVHSSQKHAARPALAIPARWPRLPRAAQCIEPGTRSLKKP